MSDLTAGDVANLPRVSNGTVKNGSEVPKILVIDDRQDFVDLVVDGLADLGARIEGVCGGYEALLRIGAFQPHLLVLDLRMPGVDGFEVCRRVKDAPATKAMRIVAMTGFDDQEAQQLAMTCGADAFVTKTAGLAALRREITSLLEADALTLSPRRGRAKTERARTAHPPRKSRRPRP